MINKLPSRDYSIGSNRGSLNCLYTTSQLVRMIFIQFLCKNRKLSLFDQIGMTEKQSEHWLTTWLQDCALIGQLGILRMPFKMPPKQWDLLMIGLASINLSNRMKWPILILMSSQWWHICRNTQVLNSSKEHRFIHEQTQIGKLQCPTVLSMYFPMFFKNQLFFHSSNFIDHLLLVLHHHGKELNEYCTLKKLSKLQKQMV